jgi:hypothetical protein
VFPLHDFSFVSNVGFSVGRTGFAAIRSLPQTICGFPALSLRSGADAGTVEEAHPLHMRRRSYAIWWNEGNGPKHVGKLEIARLHALLSGNGSSRLAVPLDDITAVEYRRGEVRIERRGATSLWIGSLDAPGTLMELAHSLES